MNSVKVTAASLAVFLVGLCLAGCGGDTRVYLIGEGAPERAGYHRAYEQSGGASGVGAPTGAVEAWSFGCRQLFKGGRSQSAVLLQQPCGRNEQVFAVTDAFWHLYRKAGEEAPATYGFPLGPQGEWKGGVTQGFGRGGGVQSFFMQRPGRPPYVVSGPVLDRYLSMDDRDVRLGFPTSEPWTTATNDLCQRFEHGVICDAA